MDEPVFRPDNNKNERYDPYAKSNDSSSTVFRPTRERKQVIADGTSNARAGSEVEARVSGGALLFYRPETNEFVVVEPQHAAAFENECRKMDYLIYEFRNAKEARMLAADQMLEAERKAEGVPTKGKPEDSQVVLEQERKLQEADSKLQAAQDSIVNEIKPIGNLDGTGDKILELIPIYPRNAASEDASSGRDKHKWGRKWTYVRSKKIKSHFRTYPLSTKERDQYFGRPQNTIITEDGKIDTKKLGQQLKNFEASGKLYDEPWASGVALADVNKSIKESLDSWARGINAGHENVEVGAEAQLLRYFAGAGLQTEWAPKEGNVALRANARGEFIVAEGKFRASCYWPDRSGFRWAITGPNTKTEYKIGLVRLAANLELYGAAGASAVAELDVAVDYTSLMEGKAGMRGHPRPGSQRDRYIDISKKARDGASGNGNIEIFAGVKAGGSIKGAFEWNSPEAREFVPLAAIGPGVGFQAGVGIGGRATITFMDGKFRILVAASACLGVGARGKLELEVDVGKTLEMMKYLAYALYATNYEFMVILTDIAFKTWQAISLLMIQTGQIIEDAIAMLGKNVEQFLIRLVQQYEKEEFRVELMKGVLDEPTALNYSPPETRGQILYQLTRHSWMTKTTHLPENQGTHLAFLKLRKEAIKIVCFKARSKADFRNMMQHMTPNGTKGSKGWEENFQHVKNFMDMGYDPDDYDKQVSRYYESLQDLYDNLYEKPVVGYSFVDNNNALYAARVNMGDHPGFNVAGGYDPGSERPDLSIIT
ncbi:hypothetical protein [Thiosocius teredinicola]|uniref:hypothetical protein n=1 Tax=Thiosocius teredinicola TaxID=1973002 RepID=UPI000F7AC94C